MPTRHQSTTTGHARCARSIKTGPPLALGSQTIKIGGRMVPIAVTPQITIAKVIHKNQDDIRLLGSKLRRRYQHDQQYPEVAKPTHEIYFQAINQGKNLFSGCYDIEHLDAWNAKSCVSNFNTISCLAFRLPNTNAHRPSPRGQGSN